MQCDWFFLLICSFMAVCDMLLVVCKGGLDCGFMEVVYRHSTGIRLDRLTTVQDTSRSGDPPGCEAAEICNDCYLSR